MGPVVPGRSDRTTPAFNSAILSDFFSQVVKHHQAGRLTEALALYDRILLLKPELAEVHSNRGVALMGLGRLQDAEVAYRQAIALNSNYGDAYNNLGNVLCDLNRLEDAEQAFREAVRLRPDCPECHLNLGTALKSQGRLEEAVTAYRVAVALRPGFADAYNNLGDVLGDLGRLEESEQALRRALALAPEFAEAFSNLGNTLKKQGLPRQAEAAYRQAIALKPHFPQAYNNLGIMLIDLGKLDDAEQALRQAIALRPQFAEAFSNLANTLYEQGRACEAEAACRAAIRLKPGHAEAHSNLGSALRDQGKLSEAVECYRLAIALKPDFADAYNNLAAVLKDLGRLAEARQAAEHAIQLVPNNPMHYYNLTEFKHFAAGDPHIAVMEKLDQNVASLPIKQQVQLHFALAKAYEDIGENEKSFRKLLTGNALRRQGVVYNEAATLLAFERLQATFTRDLMCARQGIGVPCAAPVFIVGMPRSGSTLIEQILASHPRVFGAGELPNFAKALADVLPIAKEDCGSLYPEVIRILPDEDIRRLGARYVAEVTRLAPSATCVTDKMPSNFFHVALIHLALPNARIIHAVRDPIDTCISCFSKVFLSGHYYSYDLAELGRYYRSYRVLMRHWHQVLPPGRILDVRYEDVVADLEGQARRIVSHCGLEWDVRCLAFHETERPVRTASATQVRRPLYQSAIGRARIYDSFLGPLRGQLEL
jgi:tetratricopeptide (TPR) repeat protein